MSFKTLPEVNRIEKTCKKGISDKLTKLFAMSTEPEGCKIIDSMTEIETFMVDHGMEGCFHIITPTSKINMFRDFGQLSDETVSAWVDDLLVNGVLVKHNSMSGERWEVCTQDATNLEWSGDALINSCSETLQKTIKREIEVVDRNGVRVLQCILDNTQLSSQANVRHMCNELEAMDIRKFPGENVTDYMLDAMERVAEIRANSKQAVPDLTQLAIKGVISSSDEGLRNLARQIHSDADQPDDTVTPEQALKKLVFYYNGAKRRFMFGPEESLKAHTKASAMQAYIQSEVRKANDSLGQQRQGGGGGGGRDISNYTCYNCGEKGHLSNTCSKPKTGERHSGGNQLTDAENAAVTALIGNTAKPNDDGEHNLHIDGKLVSKFCRHCNKYTKGGKLHSTGEHTRTRHGKSKHPNNTPLSGGAPAIAPAPPAPNDTGNPQGNMAGTLPAGDAVPALVPTPGTQMICPPVGAPAGLFALATGSGLRGTNHSVLGGGNTQPQASLAGLNWTAHPKGGGGQGY